MSVSFKDFYESGPGHKREHLQIISSIDLPKVYLTGDTSLDNKKYIGTKNYKAINGYENILNPSNMKGDVCFHLNYFLKALEIKYLVLNCATDDSAVCEKMTKLNQSDEFVRDNITENDILVVSIGGNDIALKSN